jgi:hypothetical protein
MSENVTTLDSVRVRLLESGLEVFRVQGQSVLLAERVRSHLMDAGVSVRVARELSADVTVRAQSSDFPTESADALFGRVRGAVFELAQSRGFREASAEAREIRDPVDDTRLLDVWYELTFTKNASEIDGLIDDVRWALRLPKCIAR